MECPLWLSGMACLLLNCLLFADSFNTSSVQLSCHDDERSVLLQFRQSFVINRSASSYENAYPKVLSWKSEGESSNCCFWDGVECDEKTGHVIGLILNSSCLYGSIDSNSSLFRLVHLQKLNLADNHFNYSLIPSAIGQFSELTFLNLSNSRFYGQIPFEISLMSKLTFLDLSTSFDVFVGDLSKSRLLELKNPSFTSLIQNLTSLEVLRLTSVYIPSMVPNFLANFTSLKIFYLQNCGLYGEFPVNIFHLPNLQVLALGWNKNLTGYLPEFHQQSPLQALELSETCFSGSIPSSIEKLESLKVLHLHMRNFSGPLPSSLGKLTQLTSLGLGGNHFDGMIPSWLGSLTQLKNLYLQKNDLIGYIPSSFKNLSQLNILSLSNNHLTGPISPFLGNLSQLTYLDLGGNHFDGMIPSWLGNLTQLKTLDLQKNNLIGYIPPSFQNLSQLSVLSLFDNHITGPISPFLGNLSQLIYVDLGGNHFNGTIPSCLGNLSQLTALFLHENELCGLIPHSLSKLSNLKRLYLYVNNLSGTVEFDMFFTMRSLVDLHLSYNTLSLVFPPRNINETTSQFIGLGLASCNLSEFPDFLRHQNKLEWLNLSRNRIHGHIPKWMWNTSVETLTLLQLNDNFLVGFTQPSPTFLPWVNLLALDLSSNLLHRQLPTPPTSIQYYSVSNNSLTGEISPLMCNLASLHLLDLSLNNLSGTVPQCLGNLNSLLVLNLRNNYFDGAIPQVCTLQSNLKMIDLGKNNFRGRLPRSLAACMLLEYLDVGKNQLTDIFPAWLGALPELKLFSLRHNRFYGVINKPKQNLSFPELHVIDLSYNNFTGKLPFQYMLIWSAMKAINNTDSIYMKETHVVDLTGTYASTPFDYVYSTTIVNKGLERYYEVIQENFAEIDFSCNKFDGEIPQFIGDLKALRSLNLSFNCLTSSIPSALGNLTELESLDLSNNKLSGEIPHQLTELTFLQYFNVSHNNLTGPIPQANQFGTFENTSFEYNPGLCGFPLSKNCEDSKAVPQPPSVAEEDDDSGSLIELDWIFVLAGCISGFVVGVVLGDMVIGKKRWFLNASRRIPPRMEIRQIRN